MSVRVMNKGAVEGSGYVHGMSCISMIESPAAEMFTGDRRFSVQDKVVVTGKEEISQEEKKVNTCSISSSSTSSIGKNSDLSSGDKSVANSSDTTDHEVQSPYKGPLNAMEALEEVLPIRRGISRFYNGKSKSFASLADASSTSSMKELAKPENAYMRRRRNLLASSCTAWEKNRSSSFLRSNGGGVSKRVTTTANRTTARALAVVTMSGGNNTGKCSAECLSPNFTATVSASSSSPSALLHSRLYPRITSPIHNFAPWRSYSLVDLQQCVSVTATTHTPSDMKPSQT